MKRVVLILFLALHMQATLRAQFPKLDANRRVVYTATEPGQKLKGVLDLLNYVNMLPTDSLAHYVAMGKKLALETGDSSALAFCIMRSFNLRQAEGENSSLINDIDSAHTLSWIKKKEPAIYNRILLIKANALNRLNRRNSAVQLQFDILKTAEAGNDINIQLYALNYLGASYFNLKQEEKALAYWNQGLQLFNEQPLNQYDYIHTVLLENTGIYYLEQFLRNKLNKAKDSAFYFLNASIKKAGTLEDMSTYAWALNERSRLYAAGRQFEEAEKDITESASILQKIGDPFYITQGKLSAARLYQAKGDYKKAESIYLATREYAMKNEQEEARLELLRGLAENYRLQNDFKSYSNILLEIDKLKDSVSLSNSLEKLVILEAENETQKNKALLAQQQVQLLRRKIWILAVSGLLVMLAMGVFVWRRWYKKKQEAKLTFWKQEESHQKNLAIIEAREKERKNLAADLHDNLGVQANAILHNTQQMLANSAGGDEIAKNLNEAAEYMLFTLRETLWVLKSNDTSAEKLWLRIINLVNQLQRNYKQIHFIVHGRAGEAFVVPSSKAIQTILIVQEALTNSIKHSGADEIMIRCHSIAQGMEIEVADNGKGFQPQEMTEDESYGLENMNSRSQQANMDLAINSQPGKGTTVTLKILKHEN